MAPMKLTRRKWIEFGALAATAMLFWSLVPFGLSIQDADKIRKGMDLEAVHTILGPPTLPAGIVIKTSSGLPMWRNGWDVSDGFIYLEWEGDNVVSVSALAYPRWKKWRDNLLTKLGW
jgi:hypothetical protein